MYNYILAHATCHLLDFNLSYQDFIGVFLQPCIECGGQISSVRRDKLGFVENIRDVLKSTCSDFPLRITQLSQNLVRNSLRYVCAGYEVSNVDPSLVIVCVTVGVIVVCCVTCPSCCVSGCPAGGGGWF